jgi:hypothetical protein
MGLIEDEEEVQAFAPDTAQKSFAKGVGLRHLIGYGQALDIGSLSDSSALDIIPPCSWLG